MTADRCSRAQEGLHRAVETRTARIDVLGLGYVGLPLAAGLGETELHCIGVGLDPRKCELLIAGQSYSSDVSDELVVLESTCYPGTTEDLLRPLLESEMEREGLPVVVIAAAGRAKRFLGKQKVVAKVGGTAAIRRVADLCEEALGSHRQLVVIGHDAEEVRAALGQAPHREYVHQGQLLGTGHALATALAHLREDRGREVFFLCGDKPMLSTESLWRLRRELATTGSAMAFLTGTLEGDPTTSRQGRVLQVHRGTPRAEVLAIVERAAIDALEHGETVGFESLTGQRHEYTREQLLAVREVNISAYVWRADVLRDHIGKLPLHPEKGEYFVTDLVHILRRERLLVRAVRAGSKTEGIGIDTREQLVAANRLWDLRQPSGRSGSRPDRAAEGVFTVEATDALL